jgi:hypothetical protein
MQIDSLRCRRIEIVDEDGHVRMILEADRRSCCILLYGGATAASSAPKLQLLSSDLNPVEIHLMGEPGTPRLSIGLFSNGDAGLTACDPEGRPVAGIGSSSLLFQGNVWSAPRLQEQSPADPK